MTKLFIIFLGLFLSWNVHAKVERYIFEHMKLAPSFEKQIITEEEIVPTHAYLERSKNAISLRITDERNACPRNVRCIWSGIVELYNVQFPIVSVEENCGSQIYTAAPRGNDTPIGGTYTSLIVQDNTERKCRDARPYVIEARLVQRKILPNEKPVVSYFGSRDLR